MLHRTVALFAVAVALALGVSDSSAQPGKGGFGGKGGGGAKQLEAEITQLREKVKELEAKLSKTEGGSKKKDEKGPPPFAGGPFGKGGWGFGPGKGFGPGAGPLANLDPEKLKRVLQIYELAYGTPKDDGKKGESKKGDFKKGDFKKGDFKRGDFKKGDFKKEFGKDKKPETGKAPMPPFGKGKGKGPGAPAASGSVESRIERLIGELEQLRRELKKK